MTIDVQSSEKEGTKDYAAVAQAIVLARRPEGVSRAELTKFTGRDPVTMGYPHDPSYRLEERS